MAPSAASSSTPTLSKIKSKFTHSSSRAREDSASANAKFDTLASWLELNGEMEYAAYKKQAVSKPLLSYEAWASSEQALGAYFYGLTLGAWEDGSSSDDEPGEPSKSSTPAAQIPRKQFLKVKFGNGTGLPHRSAPATPAAAYVNREDVDVGVGSSSKKMKKKRKSRLSEAMIAPEDMDDEVPTVSTPAVPHPETAEEPRIKKRKQKKKNSLQPTQPEEIPEQVGAHPSIARDATTPAAAAAAEASPEKGTPSSATRRGLRARTAAQQRPYFHHQRLFEDQLMGDDEDVEIGPQEGILRPGRKSRRSSLLGKAPLDYAALHRGHVPNDDEEFEAEHHLGSDEDADFQDMQLDPSASMEKKEKHFKGKGRAWKKDDDEEDASFQLQVTESAKKKRGRPRKYPRPEDLVSSQEQQKSAEVVELEGPVNQTETPVKSGKGRRKSKGKGKEEGHDFGAAVAEAKKGSAAATDAGLPSGSSKKTQEKVGQGRLKRKSHKSAEFVVESDDDSEDEVVELGGAPAPAPTVPTAPISKMLKSAAARRKALPTKSTPSSPELAKTEPEGDKQKKKRKPRKPRKSFLSAAIVLDEDDEDDEGDTMMAEEEEAGPSAPRPTTPVVEDRGSRNKKKRGSLVAAPDPNSKSTTPRSVGKSARTTKETKTATTPKSAKSAKAVTRTESPTMTGSAKRKVTHPRKSFLSAEFVKDSSDEDDEEEGGDEVRGHGAAVGEKEEVDEANGDEDHEEQETEDENEDEKLEGGKDAHVDQEDGDDDEADEQQEEKASPDLPEKLPFSPSSSTLPNGQHQHASLSPPPAQRSASPGKEQPLTLSPGSAANERIANGNDQSGSEGESTPRAKTPKSDKKSASASVQGEEEARTEENETRSSVG